MQKIFFHKTVNLDKPLKELLSISVDESIQYKLEMNGMRAIGSIVIYGEYDDSKQRNKFKENIDLDILANSEKIEDKREFLVKVEDFDYTLQNGRLKLVIQAYVYGVKDDEDKHIHVNNERIFEMRDEKIPHIESLLRQEDNQGVIENLNDEVKEVMDKSIPKSQSIVENEEDDDIGTYYFYIVQDGDSYHTIASRYKMEEKMIRDYNGNKEIREGNIIIIPYLP